MAGLDLELDHIMFFCRPGAPEADALLGRGLHEGPGNSHPGQGTVNRRFFFRNVYLELVWIENFVEAQQPEVQRTGIWERWVNRGNGGCPIGLVFRPGPGGSSTPFPSWTYVPKYFPSGFSIEVAHGIPPNEPLLFYLPFARPALVENVSPMPGGVEIGAVQGTTLHLPETTGLSPALNSLVAKRLVAIEPGREVLVDVHHTTESREIIDLRPTLPLRFLPVERRNPAAH
ncbi:MAG TPA: VOC family protein [Steroidobacteraceae bacterium]|nr:VOC family protein [Steroidobacteraceae bacterium]